MTFDNPMTIDNPIKFDNPTTFDNPMTFDNQVIFENPKTFDNLVMYHIKTNNLMVWTIWHQKLFKIISNICYFLDVKYSRPVSSVLLTAGPSYSSAFLLVPLRPTALDLFVKLFRFSTMEGRLEEESAEMVTYL